MFAVAGDLVPSSAMIRRVIILIIDSDDDSDDDDDVRKVYDSPMVMRFLAKASGKQRMFQMDDEFQCINIMCR